MKVLLVNPWQAEIFPPPSLGYLQAVLKKAGVDVIARDLAEAMLLDPDDYDIVAATFHSFSVRYAKTIRNKFTGRLVCGGHHVSALPQQLLDIGYDQVVIGEGENAILDIVNGNTDKIIHGTMCDIETLPFPDYTGFRGEWTMGIPIISSRGCPFDCSFCASAEFWHRKWRMRSAQNVIEEVISCGYRTFMFEDDNFTLNKNRAIAICKELIRIGGFSWQCASRAESLVDDELCWHLKKAGCHTVWLGVESLSQDSLDRCSKKTTVEVMLTGINTAHQYGLSTMSQFIIGLPGDTIANINETVKNIKRAKIGRLGSNVLWVLPNTDIHKKAKEKGFDDSVYLTDGEIYYTFEQDMNTLNHWANLIKRA
jgi:radical SAM superfamily enzyme YgiQ (UPF0313 family)